jgi:hypothetical protein
MKTTEVATGNRHGRLTCFMKALRAAKRRFRSRRPRSIAPRATLFRCIRTSGSAPIFASVGIPLRFGPSRSFPRNGHGATGRAPCLARPSPVGVQRRAQYDRPCTRIAEARDRPLTARRHRPRLPSTRRASAAGRARSRQRRTARRRPTVRRTHASERPSRSVPPAPLRVTRIFARANGRSSGRWSYRHCSAKMVASAELFAVWRGRRTVVATPAPTPVRASDPLPPSGEQ